MVNSRRVRWVRTAVAGAVASVSLVFVAGPADAGGPPPRQGGSLLDLLNVLRGGQQTPPPQVSTPPTTAARTTAPPTTAASSATTATTAPGGTISGTLEAGSKGPQVRTLEARLDTLHYFVGPIDETYDEQTAQAVMAFQKVNGMNRTGKLDQSTWSSITTAKDPAPLVSGGGHRVEVDIARQALFLYEGGKLSKILPVSSGNGEDYCEGGSCGTANTPRGDFKIYRQGTGWEYGPLGGLYNPQYFVGGYAIHGSLSVPAEPASHGCIRIPMGAADWFPEHVSNGTPVHVRG
ncbi:MAG: L,D-transpeptidase family protein [Acidimicrobiales bacterium]